MGDVDLAEAKRRIGNEVCLMGYGDMLYVIKMGTPRENVRTYFEAAQKYGRLYAK